MPKQSRPESHERRIRILKIAIGVFLRFGYAKTTLGDVAKTARVHRPVLYGLFPSGKEELFEAALILWVEEIIDGYKARVANAGTVRQGLLLCAEHWCVERFKLTVKHPDARDAFDIRYPAVKKMYELLTNFYAELLSEAVERSSLSLTAAQLAELLVFSLRGVRQIPSDVEGMRDVVRREMELFLAALNYRPGASDL